MRKLAFVFSLIILVSAFTSKKKKEFVPPGTIKISDTLYADIAEISNLQWYVYTCCMKETYGLNSKEYISALPDTTVWTNNHPYNLSDHYVAMYRKHSIYMDYPAVGINYEQALNYCKWRTENDKHLTSKKYPGLEFEYRLPSKQEWESMAASANEVYTKKNYAVYTKIDKDHEECNVKYRANCKIECPNDSNDICNLHVTRHVKGYKSNSYGMYDMIGNVSEMVLEKGISKGGSWKHTLEESRVGKDISYTKPTAWLGFRCVCVVKRAKV